MPSARLAAIGFGALSLILIGFQVALALGAPWGGLAMGGAVQGVYPPPMRLAALAQAGVNLAMAAVVFSRAGLLLPPWRVSRVLIWIVVALNGFALVLNLITPSAGERILWAPVAAAMLACAVRVALSR